MFDAALREINGWVYAAFGAEALVAYQAHPLGYLVAGAAVGAVLSLAAAWLAYRAARRRVRRISRGWALVRSGEGRRALARAREIRRIGRRLWRGIERSGLDPRERRELAALVRGFLAGELEDSLDRLRGWLDLGGSAVPALQRRLEQETRAWSAAAPGAERSRAEQSAAHLRQQLALAAQAEGGRAELLAELDSAATTFRALEAELWSLGQARTDSLPRLRRELDELADHFRHQRLAHLEFRARPA
jgi:hypothetical protein